MNSPSKVAAKKVLVISVLISLFSPMSILAAEDIAKSGKDNINYAFSGASNSLKKLKRRTGKTVSKLVEDVSTTIADANEGLVESIARESRKESETNIEIRQEQLPPSQPQPSASVDFDFDGDGKADFAKWNQGAANIRSVTAMAAP